MDIRNKELETLKEEQNLLNEEVRSFNVTSSDIERYLREFEEVIAQGNNHEKKLLLRHFIDHLEVDPETKKITVSFFGTVARKN